MKKVLEGKRVAVVATDGFEQSELLLPKKALEEAGAAVDVVSLKAGKIKGWSKGNWADAVEVNATIDTAKAQDYDALMLPGGVMNPDRLRWDEGAVHFIQDFVDSGKPIAAICHGPWTLIETGVVRGKNMTSWPSLRTDLINAGAQWEDNEVVVDNGLITSRKPDDIPAFNKKMIEEFAAGPHDTSLFGKPRSTRNERHTH